jgi:hypothetical protein
MAAGLGGLGELLVPVRPRAGLAVATLGIVGPIAALAARPPVYRLQEARPLLQWVSARRLPSDPVFVWYRAAPNVRWYGRSSGLLSGEIIWGGCWLGEPRRFLRELDQLRGKPRAWLIIAGSGSSAVGLLLRYADSLGSRREQTRVVATLPGYFPMEAMLYDFSDSDRLSRFSAETFPMGQVQAPAQAVQACNLGPVVARAERAPATPGRAP